MINTARNNNKGKKTGRIIPGILKPLKSGNDVLAKMDNVPSLFSFALEEVAIQIIRTLHSKKFINISKLLPKLLQPLLWDKVQGITECPICMYHYLCDCCINFKFIWVCLTHGDKPIWHNFTWRKRYISHIQSRIIFNECIVRVYNE